MNRKGHVLILFFLLMWFGLKAQYVENDARFWFYLKLNARLSPRLKAELNLQNRFNNNVSEYSQININPELNYKINKTLKLTGGVVLGKIRGLDGLYNNRQQVYLGFNLRQRVGRAIFIYRNLVQGQTTNWHSSDKGQFIRYIDRNKFTVKYDLSKRAQVYMAEELTFPFYRTADIGIYRYRTFAGTKYDLSRDTYLEAYFILQAKLGFKGMPEHSYIYGLTYSYTF
ncbi:MAG TPA: DUF2490 domain-containing protein [Bacteroidia bacterium]|nr:DUF2490 domain-containing protein [Bacteroidia bacterium]